MLNEKKYICEHIVKRSKKKDHTYIYKQYFLYTYTDVGRSFCTIIKDQCKNYDNIIPKFYNYICTLKILICVLQT